MHSLVAPHLSSPFTASMRGGGYVVAPAVEEALARLLFLVEQQRPCGVVAGPAGAGKSALLRAAQARTAGPGCRWIWWNADATAFTGDGGRGDRQFWREWMDQLAGAHAVGRHTVIAIDAADELTMADVVQIRRLDRAARLMGARCSVIAVLSESGEPGVNATLEAMADLRCELPAWTVDDVAVFLQESLHRVSPRDGESTAAMTFRDCAIERIAACTRGLPREIVRLCDFAWLAAVSNDERSIDGEFIEAAERERRPAEPAHRRV